MIKKYVILCLVLSVTFKSYGDCTPADMSLVGFTPSVIDFTSATTVSVNFQTSHNAFSGTERCFYFGFLDYGSETSWTTRYLTHQTTGDTIPFNVHSRASTNNASRVRLASDANRNVHVIFTNPRFFVASPSVVSQTNTFFAKLGTLPISLEPGLYSESLIFRLAARLTNPPAGDWEVWPVVLSRAIQFMYRVEKELSLSIVASGGVFDPLSTAKLMSFGEIESSESRSADVIIKTNVGYRLTASSVNDGSMKHNAGAAIPYTFRASGNTVNLIGSSTSPAVVSSSASNSPSTGFLIPIEVEVGVLTGNEPGGEYKDILSLTVEAF